LADPATIGIGSDRRPASWRLALKHRHYSYRRIGALLRREGWQANHKWVPRLLRENNLLCLRQTPFVPITTNSRHSGCVVPNLARGIALNGPDQLWVADITYLHLAEGFGCLAIVLDAFSRNSQSAVGAFIETVYNRGNAVGNLSPHDQHEWRRLPTGPPGAGEAVQERRDCEHSYFNICATLSFVTRSRPV
jgi:hypothetical protein